MGLYSGGLIFGRAYVLLFVIINFFLGGGRAYFWNFTVYAVVRAKVPKRVLASAVRI